MAGAIIKVSPEKLIATAQDFNSQGNNIRQLTTQMLNIVASLASVWEGDAALAYMNKFKSLENDIQVMCRMINEHVNDLQQIATSYSSAEQSNAEDAASLVSGVIS